MQKDNSKNIANMSNEDVVREYTRAYLERFKKIDPKALADAFVGWDAKYNMWVEDSLMGSEGYSPEDANNITKAINEKAKPDTNKGTELGNAIKQHMGKEYGNYGEYTLSYARMFTKMKSTDKLYIQAASDFFETGKLPPEIPSQEVASRLAKAIEIRSGILKVGTASQQEQKNQRETEIAPTGKKPREFVQNTLLERTKIAGTQVTYGQVFSELCQGGQILPMTQSTLCPDGKRLSQSETDQIKEAIRRQVEYSGKKRANELKKAFFNRTQQDKKLSEYVEDCLKKLRHGSNLVDSF